jgi:tetratricopeptide (TPR) repeat protein
MKTNYPHLVLVVLCVSLLAVTVTAQIPGGMNEVTKTGMGGNNFVAGTVFLPSGRPIDYRITIRLTSRARGDIIASTDHRGQFIFSGVDEGQYSIVVDSEKEFEPVTQNVDVDPARFGRSPTGQTFTVTIRLSERRNGPTKASVVNTGNASKKATDLYNEAIILSNLNDHKGAVQKLKQAVAESPKYLTALNQLASEYMALGELDKAEQPLRAALAIDPSAYEPLANLGIVLFRTKKFTEATAAFTKALEANGSSAVAHFYLGRIDFAESRPDAAIKHLTETVRIGADQFKEAHRLLAVLYLDKGERSKVVEHLETYLKLVPNAKDADELRVIIQQNKNPR